MARFALVTDSTSDLPASLAEERRIYVVPMHIMWGERENLRDGIDLPHGAIYERLAREREMPTTSQPSPAEYVDAFRRAREASDAEAVIAMTMSSELSGSYFSAMQASRMVDFPAYAVDSRTGSMALGLAALAVAEARDAGVSVEAALTLAQESAARTHMIFLLDTLEYLYRSGRVDGWKRMLSDVLRIKPLLHVRNGRIDPLEVVRTRRRALERLLQLFGELVDRSKSLRVGVLHGNAPQDLEAFVAEIKARWNPAFLMQGVVSSGIAVHTGPRSLGFAMLQL